MKSHCCIADIACVWAREMEIIMRLVLTIYFLIFVVADLRKLFIHKEIAKLTQVMSQIEAYI